MTKETYKFENREQYIKALDSVINEQSYVKVRKLAQGRTTKYLPVPIQQAIADAVFQEWNVIDEQYITEQNELIAMVKLQYIPSYPGADPQICTGTAAKAIGMASGSTVNSYPAKKKVNALEYCLPAARSSAIGNALETLANIFGRNIGRKIEQMDVESTFNLRGHKKEEGENAAK